MKDWLHKQKKINQYKIFIRKLRLQKEGVKNEEDDSKKINSNK
ncbi:hypothetical protein ACTFOJ_01090 [Bacillus cereus group sp. MYBK77-1]|nr:MULTISPECIES: hypothetical protein [Bacillus cereus group]EDZ59347.1 hypothetical protein BCH308197_2908 [Bacillus cereus H3081.97]KKZ96518.1 hypothetical protein B4086_2797 [Bacillus cereus]MDX5914429.1 hypothetical protein [Bacillus cereus group sp. BfR-BA-01026]